MIDKDKIAELRRLEAEATPGPWKTNVAISQSFAKRQRRPISGAFDHKHTLPPHGGVDV